MNVSKEVADKVLEIRSDAEKAAKKQIVGFAINHNTISIGDVITDHYHTMRVKSFKIFVCTDTMNYDFFYKGVELTKKRTSHKKAERPRNVWSKY